MKRNLMSMMKKGFAVVLVAGAACLAAAPMTAMAASSKTQKEAVEWAKSQIDNGVATTCSQLPIDYYRFLGDSTTKRPHAKTFADNQMIPTTGGTYIPLGKDIVKSDGSIPEDKIPQPGDVVVFYGPITAYGHVGIVLEADAKKVVFVDRNGDGSSTANTVTDGGKRTKTYKQLKESAWGGIIGLIRPDFAPEASSGKSVQDVMEAAHSWIDDAMETAAREAEAALDRSGTYRIKYAPDLNQVLNVYTSKSPAHKMNCTIYAYDAADTKGTQVWTLEKKEGGYVIHSGTKGVVLNVSRDGKAQAGDNVNIYNAVDDATQLWTVRDLGDGKVAFLSASNPALALTATGSAGSGKYICTDVRLAAYDPSNGAQQWVLEKLQ
ncbi:MAG: RICIN domain-containing protein [Lachnospiraceae bacterium]|nr:RICIN domain-containing protein [Lachnospiraceae bacterium]